MKFYEHKEATPLRFFKFYRSIILPLGILGGLYIAVSNSISLLTTTYDWHFVFSFSRNFLQLALNIVILTSLFKWKRYAVTSVFMYMGLDVLGAVHFFLYSTTIKHYIFVMIIILWMLVCFIGCLIFIYLYKRKNLFDGVPYIIPKYKKKQRKALREYYAENSPEDPEIVSNQKLCQCGFPVAVDRQSCPDCGRTYEK